MSKDTDKKVTTPADPEHEHYEWGASAAKQWRGCHGSVAFTRIKQAEGVIPDDNSTEWSREGTEAHNWADKALKGEIEDNQIPTSFFEHLIGYLELALDLAAENGGEVYNEQQVPYFYNPDKTGTLDYAVVSAERVDILDLKYGVGVYVAAEDNDQLAIYALSLMKQFDEDDYQFTDATVVRMHIYQPRHRDFDGVPEIWETTYRDLLDFAIDIEADYHASKAASPDDLRPSKSACQFCDARRVCGKRVIDLFDGIPDELNPLVGDPDVAKAAGAITNEVRVRIFEKHKEIAKFFADIVDDTTALIEQGKLAIAELKVVDGGKGNRKWGDNEEEADKLLRKIPAADRYQPKKLISPAQVEKVLKKSGLPLEKQSTRFRNRFIELIQQSDGKPVLALASDPRKARTPTLTVFDDETEVAEDDCF
jgi:hypothetical protein